MSWISTCSDGVMIVVRAIPRASRDMVQGVHNDALKIRILAPPVEGKANKALVKLLSRKLNMPRSRIELVAGETTPLKRIKLYGLTEAEVTTRLLT